MPRSRDFLDEMEEASMLLRKVSFQSVDPTLPGDAAIESKEDEQEFVDDHEELKLEEIRSQPPPNAKSRCGYQNHRVCTVCSKLPLRRPLDPYSRDFILDWDDGLLDIIRHFNENECDAEIPSMIIETTVEMATSHLNRLKRTLMENGLQRHKDQNYSFQSINSARVVAPLDINEIEIGNLLGSGGFGAVLEVRNIHLCDRPDRRKLSETEKQSRRFLENHARVHPDGVPLRKQKEVAETADRRNERLDNTDSRYAIKHLRGALLRESADKFRRAAADLAQEGQILMVLDHPGIISIRGWAAEGPAAFRGGFTSSFFLVLDRLPCTLEEKIWDWRQKSTMYKRRSKRRTTWRGRSIQIRSLLSSCALVSSNPAEDMRPPDKYAVKMLAQLIARLNAAKTIASAIFYMHSKRIIHRDIKLSNIGLDVHGDAKLFDFGLARLLPKKCSESFLMSRVGSTFYMSPEIQRKEQYGTPADTYSFGVVLWELLSLSSARDYYQQIKEEYIEAERRNRPSPTDYPAVRDIVKNGGEGTWLPICSCWSADMAKLVTSVLGNGPESRPTMQQVDLSISAEVESLLRVLREYAPEHVLPKRRRSTFRVDLSNLISEKVDEDSGTARSATFRTGDFLTN